MATALLATAPAPAKPLTGGVAAPLPQPDSPHAYSRDLFYRKHDAFTVRSIPTVAPPAKARRVDEPPGSDTGGSLLIGIGLAGAGVVVGAAGMARRRRVAV